jgi:hypothetical protein
MYSKKETGQNFNADSEACESYWCDEIERRLVTRTRTAYNDGEAVLLDCGNSHDYG